MNPSGTTRSSAIGTVPRCGCAGKYFERSPGSGPPWPRKHQEERLSLPDDVAGHSDHDVVEPAVREVVLDPRAADPRDSSVVRESREHRLGRPERPAAGAVDEDPHLDALV